MQQRRRELRQQQEQEHLRRVLQQQEPEPEPPGPPPLPPGWRAVWDPAWCHWYYVNFEAHHSQWYPRPHYTRGDWKRTILATFEGDRAYWISEELTMAFDELRSTDWKRYQDHRGQMYWSCAARQIRFWELHPGEQPEVEP